MGVNWAVPSTPLQLVRTTPQSKPPSVPTDETEQYTWKEASECPSNRLMWHLGHGWRESCERLTCKGFHFPAFQGGRRKRTNNESKKMSQRMFWKVTALQRGVGTQEALFISASWVCFLAQKSQLNYEKSINGHTGIKQPFSQKGRSY